MNPLSPLRRAADDFAAVLDGSGTDPHNRFGDARAAYDLLASHASTTPSPDFTADLRARLLHAAADLGRRDAAEPLPASPTAAPAARRRARWIGIAAAMVALVGGSTGAAVAAAGSLPGETLYPLKRGMENAKLLLVYDSATKADSILDNADHRSQELRELVEGGDAVRIEQALTDFRQTALHGSELVFTGAESTRDASQLDRVKQFAARQMDELEVASQRAPIATRDAFAQAATTLAALDQRATELCGSCHGVLVEVPRVLMQSTASLGRLLAVPVSQTGNPTGRVRTPSTPAPKPPTAASAAVTARAKTGAVPPDTARSTSGTPSVRTTRERASQRVTLAKVQDENHYRAQPLTHGLTTRSDALTGDGPTSLSGLLPNGLDNLLNRILGPATLPPAPPE